MDKNSDTSFIYQAKVGAFGEVIFFKDPESGAYCFTFFNGEEYTPVNLSPQAAYYVWAFIGCEHPDASISTFTPPKKAGRGKPKKRPSLTSTKKKAKNK